MISFILLTCNILRVGSKVQRFVHELCYMRMEEVLRKQNVGCQSPKLEEKMPTVNGALRWKNSQKLLTAKIGEAS